jgi:hypothetical protein
MELGMSGIKGIVILSRFEYVENNFGKDKLAEMITEIDFDNKRRLKQPIGVSKEYSENLLSEIDKFILKKYFDNDVKKFRELGRWNAPRLVSRYMQTLIDEKSPQAFIEQMVYMRPILFGLGDMKIVELEKRYYEISINYGQPYIPSIMESELGYLEEGCRLCGAKNVHLEMIEAGELKIDFTIRWEK